VHKVQAETIRRYLRSHEIRYDTNILPRPFCVEITGTPCSGKSALIDQLYNELRKLGLRVERPQEGAQVIPHIPRMDPVFNTRAGLYALNLLIDRSFGHSCDVVIFERCIFDAYCWMAFDEEKKGLKKVHKDSAREFFLSGLWSPFITRAYFLVCDPSVAIARDLRDSPSQVAGNSTTEELISAMIKMYKNAHAELSPRFPQLKMLDTTYVNQQQMVQAVLSDILEVFCKKADGSS